MDTKHLTLAIIMRGNCGSWMGKEQRIEFELDKKKHLLTDVYDRSAIDLYAQCSIQAQHTQISLQYYVRRTMQ